MLQVEEPQSTTIEVEFEIDQTLLDAAQKAGVLPEELIQKAWNRLLEEARCGTL
jgi:hypothetical protein